MWGVGKARVAASWLRGLMFVFEEIFDRPIKFSGLNFSSSSTLNFSEDGRKKTSPGWLIDLRRQISSRAVL
jgi:hypothetical protein